MKWRCADFIVIAVVLICALGIWLYPAMSSTGTYAEIQQMGNVHKLPLGTDTTLQIENATVIVKDGAIAISSAECPDQVCVKTGAISREGESIVCVPNKIVITIEGASLVDAISN